jgi:hypothetical protein
MEIVRNFTDSVDLISSSISRPRIWDIIPIYEIGVQRKCDVNGDDFYSDSCDGGGSNCRRRRRCYVVVVLANGK